MMENPKPDEENVLKDIKNAFRLKKELHYTGIKDIRVLKNKTKAIKDRIPRDTKNLFEHEEEENYFKPVIASSLWSNICIEYESDRDWYNTLSVEGYLPKIRPYLKDIINNLKKSNRWKVHNYNKQLYFLNR